MDRDNQGRFLPGNSMARRDGQARMAALTSTERTALAKQGFKALADKWGWSRRKTAAWLFDPLGYRNTP